MAERTVNVNINYRVNTVEVQKAAQESQKAQQATDNLRKSTEAAGAASAKASSQAASSNRTWGTSIEGIRVKQQQLAAQISLTNKNDTAKLKALSAQYKEVSKELQKLTKEYLTLSNAQKQVNTTQQTGLQGLQGLVSAARAFIAVGFVREIFNVSTELARLSGTVDAVGGAFSRQIPGSEYLLMELQRATHNTVTELELMQKALQAQNFGIDVQRLPQLLEFAAVRAQQTGQSVDYLVNSIVTGIGRKSLLILDNLGISATRLKAEFNGASLASQNVGDVTAAVGRIAQEELTKMGGYLETNATKVDQLTANWENLKASIATTFAGDFAGEFIGYLSEIARNFGVLTEAMKHNKDASQVFEESLRKQEALTQANSYATFALTGTREENIKTLDAEIQRLTHSIGQWSKYRDVNEEVIASLEKSIEVNKQTYQANQDDLIYMAQAIKDHRALIDAKKDDVLFEQELVKILQIRLDQLKKVDTAEKERLGLVERARERIKSLQEQIEKAESEQALVKLNRQLQLANGHLNDLLALGIPLNKMFSDLGKSLDNKKIIDGLTKTVDDATEQLINYDFNRSSMASEITARFEEGLRNLNLKAEVTPIVPLDAWDKLEIAFAEGWRDIVSTGIFSITDVISAGLQAEADMYDQRLNQVKDYYSQQEAIAGDNERARDILRQRGDKKEKELRRQAFEADRKAKRQTTIINGAAAVVNAFATLPYPAAVVASILIAAQTAAQIAVINKQTAKFAKGGLNIQGPGNATSDSIPAMISKGESVMTAAETKGSYRILKAVRANKLDDRVMSDIVSGRSGGQSVVNMFDDSRIVKEIQDLKRGQPDYVKQGNIIYESRRYSDTYKKKTRSKAMGI